ncbi:uncharacterized protein LOC144920082 [Branchiostoma floridae x Branchiostoma belcheri]
MADEGRGPPDPHPGPPDPYPPGPPDPHPPHGPHVYSYHDGYLDWMGFVIALIILIVVVKVIILICWLCGRNKRQGYVRLQGGAGNTYHATVATETARTQPRTPPSLQPHPRIRTRTRQRTSPRWPQLHQPTQQKTLHPHPTLSPLGHKLSTESTVGLCGVASRARLGTKRSEVRVLTCQRSYALGKGTLHDFPHFAQVKMSIVLSHVGDGINIS